MLTIILFVLGLIFLFRRKYTPLLTIIIVLSSTFLQLQIVEGPMVTISGYNTYDFGLLLYLLLFFQVASRNGCRFKGKVQQIVTLFLLFLILNVIVYKINRNNFCIFYKNYFGLFLILNGVFDIIYNGTSIGDVIKYLKNWLLITIVYIHPYINIEYTIKSLKQIYNITLILCIFISICMLLKFDLGILWYNEGRGIKPPPDCMWFSVLAFSNIWGKSKNRAIIDAFIFILPVILSLKMTYAITIALVFTFYIILNKNIAITSKVGLSILMFFSISFTLIVSSDFSERLSSVAAETNDISRDEQSGNFSYRILHAQERLEFIMNDPVMSIRGFGYLHEKNLKKVLFVYGTNHGQQQLDTGDIAWSLFFIRLGFLGIFLYLIMYFTIVKTYYINRNKKICLIFSSMLISYLIFTSLGNCIITYSYFFIYPILFLNITNKDHQYYIPKKYSNLI